MLPTLLVVAYHSSFATRLLLLYAYLVPFVVDVLQIARKYAAIVMAVLLGLASMSIWAQQAWMRGGRGWLLAYEFVLVLACALMWGLLQFPWVWTPPQPPPPPQQQQQQEEEVSRLLGMRIERVLFSLLPVPACAVLVWQLGEARDALSWPPQLETFSLAQGVVFAVYHVLSCAPPAAQSSSVSRQPHLRRRIVTGKVERAVHELMAHVLVPGMYLLANQYNNISNMDSMRRAEETVLLASLPLFFKLQTSRGSSSSSSYALVAAGGAAAVLLSLHLAPTRLLAALAVFNVAWNHGSLEHWLASGVAWSFSLASAASTPSSSSFAVLSASYAMAGFAWWQGGMKHGGGGGRPWLVMLAISLGLAAWELFHSWFVLAGLACWGVARVVRDERVRARFAALAVMCAVLAERDVIVVVARGEGVLASEEHRLAYVAGTTALLLLVVAAAAMWKGEVLLQPVGDDYAKLALMGGFARWLFALPMWTVSGGFGLVLLVLPLVAVTNGEMLLLPLTILVELALCGALATAVTTTSLVFPAVLCVVVVSASIWLECQLPSSSLGRQLRSPDLRWLVLVLLVAPLLAFVGVRQASAAAAAAAAAGPLVVVQVTAVECALYVALAALGMLTWMLDVFPDWVVLAVTGALAFTANPAVGALTVASLYSVMVCPVKRRRAAVAGVAVLALITAHLEQYEPATCCWLLIVLAALADYLERRGRVLRELNFDATAEQWCCTAATGAYCLVVVSCSSQYGGGGGLMALALLGAPVTVLPFALKCRLVLALQVGALALNSSSTGAAVVRLAELAVFLLVCELNWDAAAAASGSGDGTARMLFAAPLLGALVLLQPSLLVSACTLMGFIAYVWQFRTPTLEQVAVRMHQTL